MLKSIIYGLLLSGFTLGMGCMRPSNSPLGTIEYTTKMEFEGNLVQVPISVNGAPAQPFILDTGLADTILSQDYAHDAGTISTGESVKRTGVGGDAVLSMDVVKNLLVDLEGLQFAIGGAMVAPADLTRYITGTTGQPFYGMMGAPLFESFVVELDYQQRQLTLYPPKNYQYTGSGEILPLSIHQQKPYLTAWVQSTPEAKPTKGRFLLDLGSNQSLDLRGNIEVPNGLPLRHASGLGGEVQIPVGRIHQLKLGTYELLEPITAFEATDRHNSNRLSGRIGNQILSRFKVIFNYAKKQVILEPIQETASPIEADMSGLRLALNDSPSREVVINHVYPNSPAQSAGIRAGDRLLAIDGQSVDTFSLSDIRQQFLGPPQTIREVLLERAETALSVRLQLRRLI